MEFLKKENFNIPNILSFIRIIIIVPFVLYFLNDDYLLAALMLIFSGLSDMFDGLIARKLNQITKLGKVLDPVADKLTLTAVIICMGIKFPEIFPLVIILIFYISVIIIVALKAIWEINSPVISISLLSATAVFMLFALFKYFIIFLKLIDGIGITKEKFFDNFKINK